jgi:hypothetical protein
MDKIVEKHVGLARSYYMEYPSQNITPSLILHAEDGNVLSTLHMEDVSKVGKVAKELLERNVCETVVFVSEGYELDAKTRERTGRDMLTVSRFDKGMKHTGYVAIINDKATGDFMVVVDGDGEMGGRVMDGFLDDGGEKTKQLMKKIE